MTPLRQFILKVHSRCDLACSYCYVYEMADDRWRARPTVMSTAVMDHTARRIGEHTRAHGSTDVEIVLHGGEPLLAGVSAVEHCVRQVRRAVGAQTRVWASVQTNGVRLDDRFLTLFDELDVRVGISLDGDRAAHDRHRLDRRGQGSFMAVTRALRRLTDDRYRHLFAGLLCTIDLANDPVTTYEALLEFGPPTLDLLLPHGNWEVPPPGRDPDPAVQPYGEWLSIVFDRWYDAPVRETRIRIFDEIIRLLLGRASRMEGLGFGDPASVVIETDGSIEEADHLSAVRPQASATGLNVTRNCFDEVLHRSAAAGRRSAGPDDLCLTCRSCRLLTVCGGGLYSHRYRRGSGFDNPSVYCPDLTRLIEHVHARVADDVRQLSPTAGTASPPRVAARRTA